jgi:hypothetical protein
MEPVGAGYTPERQIRLLSRVRIRPEELTAMLVAGAAIEAGADGHHAAAPRRGGSDPVQHAYRAFCRKLRRAGAARPGEGPSTSPGAPGRGRRLPRPWKRSPA